MIEGWWGCCLCLIWLTGTGRSLVQPQTMMKSSERQTGELAAEKVSMVAEKRNDWNNNKLLSHISRKTYFLLIIYFNFFFTTTQKKYINSFNSCVFTHCCCCCSVFLKFPIRIFKFCLYLCFIQCQTNRRRQSNGSRGSKVDVSSSMGGVGVIASAALKT